ncbi:MAG: 16S rRNA (guanine966-N2)-methyltransferase [Oceanospirillaceae bacterium]|jgi:16S rRNA (guanine966-N2)-methyltransferase
MFMARKLGSKPSRSASLLRSVGIGPKLGQESNKETDKGAGKVVAIGQAGRQSLRIIGGEWRGRKIPFATAVGLRPTQDRVRETLFNWVASQIPGATCLDLFAGTGALGLEALSRGAKQVNFVDLSNIATSSLNDNLKLLPVAEGQVSKVEQMSSFNWLRSYKALSETSTQIERYDLVFLDPPFALALMQDTLTALFDSQCLAAKAMIYVEQPQPLTDLILPEGWKLHRSKKAGQVFYGLISR